MSNLHSINGGKNTETGEPSKPTQSITVYIQTESVWNSTACDVGTLGTAAAFMVLNAYTANSGFLNFLIGSMLILGMIGRGVNEYKRRIVRGATNDEVLAKLRVKLETEDFK